MEMDFVLLVMHFNTVISLWPKHKFDCCMFAKVSSSSVLALKSELLSPLLLVGLFCAESRASIMLCAQLSFIRLRYLKYPFTSFRLAVVVIGWIDVGLHFYYRPALGPSCFVSNFAGLSPIETLCRVFVFLRLLQIVNVLEVGPPNE